MRKTWQERFWEKVEKSDDCWVWVGARNLQGYGKIYIQGKYYGSHRVSYVLENGEIPDGMVVDHRCFNPPCVNPLHLRAATYKQNNENQQHARASNRSGVRGVTWDKARNKWLAGIRHHGRTYNLGRFNTIEEAERVVVAKRIELFTHSDMELRI